MNTTVVQKAEGGILEVQLNRPEKKNALTTEMYTLLAEAVDRASEDAAIRCLLFTGSHGSFCSGNDIGDFLENPASGEDHPVARFMRALADFSKPAVAAVQGPAVGIGSTLLLHCDLVYAGRSARFAMPFVNLGICPEFASSYILPRLVGYPRAAEILLLGEPFDAEHAANCQLVNAVLEDDAVEAKAREMAAKLAAKPPKALRTTKELMRRWTHETAQRAIREEAEIFMAMLHEPEAKEAFTAFVEKRKPDFSSFS
ncbi:enoyl-CoA hydratase [Algiphilus aromaticivorans]|uniref:enoyl-CoA hydratase n=1 Tax=Algiphilus aromaticivorans TaxID=382454 RepID=UPI0005C17E31|nr:enoyl-CoA hydratase [Algiphilus aromaticivorans]